MKKLFILAISACTFLNISASASRLSRLSIPSRLSSPSSNDSLPSSISISNPWMWADVPDPDIIRVGDYYYLVSTTMHLMPGGPIMRSTDLVNWEVVSYLFDTIKDTPRYDLEEGTVYGRGQWATSIRYHNGTFWALFVANDEPHKSMVFETDDPAKGWKLHSRLPAYHDASLFFDDDDRVYVFSGSGDIHLVELESDLTAEKKGGVHKTLQLNGKPEGLHEGSRVIKHDGMYYLLNISWPRTGRQEIAYRSKNIEGPYDMKVILKSDFGGFPLAGQGTIVDGKHGEWYGVIFQDRGGVGRVLTLEPCSWIDGWPMLGKIPETVTLTDDFKPIEGKKMMTLSSGVHIEKDFQWNHNPRTQYIKEVKNADKSTTYELTTCKNVESIFTAPNSLTWRMLGPTCSDTVKIDARDIADGDKCGFAAFNGDSGILTITREGNKYFLVMSEESCEMEHKNKSITGVKRNEIQRVEIPKSKLKNVYLCIDGDFNVNRDIATFKYSFDNKHWQKIGSDFKMRFDYMRLFMGTRYATFYYSTKSTGGKAKITVK